VQAAVVLVRDAEPENIGPELVAYVVLVDGVAEHSTIRGHLASRLPGYMVPRGIVPMQSFPSLANGKIDRKALREAPLPREAAGDGGAEDGSEALGHRLRGLLCRLGTVDWSSDADGASDSACHLLREVVSALVAHATGVEAPALEQGQTDDDADLVALGIDSISAVPLAELLSRWVLRSHDVPLEDIYVYGTLPALCGYLRGRLLDLRSRDVAATPGGSGVFDATAAPALAERSDSKVRKDPASKPESVPEAEEPPRRAQGPARGRQRGAERQSGKWRRARGHGSWLGGLQVWGRGRPAEPLGVRAVRSSVQARSLWRLWLALVGQRRLFRCLQVARDVQSRCWLRRQEVGSMRDALVHAPGPLAGRAVVSRRARAERQRGNQG